MADRDPHAPPTPTELPEHDGLDELIHARLEWLRGDAEARYLRADHEVTAMALAVDKGFDQAMARKAIARWLRDNAMVREETLRTQAMRALNAGRRQGAWVRARVIDSAEQTLVAHGMPPQQAAVEVAQLLQENGLRDERELLAHCERAIAAYVAQHCSRGSCRARQLHQLIEIAEQRGANHATAERWVRRFLDERGIQIKRGLL